ncbi:hypothetical protein GCM10022631_40940 [Deinococcus rubellus]|uniref:Uncharacterized protein n=1 Tax=Deinococcus rubellus TaxID=1889240 RepID=A0ABY5YGE3_9DEIO|nr:hypothetical protein [Deinococcus rubellus]UWX63883.1 hypothetical protein N0D28_14325 [Deinococcus rubellus]
MLKALPQTYGPVRAEPELPAALRPASKAALDEAESAAPSYLGVALALLVVPLGLAWATQGAWLSVLPLGVLLLALCAWTIYEDARERRDAD